MRLARCLGSVALLTSWACPMVVAFTSPCHHHHVRTVASDKNLHPFRSDFAFHKTTLIPSPRVHYNVDSSRQGLFGRNKAAATAAATAAVASSVTALPSWQAVSLACLLPSCLGYYKREYGVSYAYGGAVSITAYLVYRSLVTKLSLAGWHALALIFYGIRLSWFLFYRELTVPKMREFRDNIEEKAEGDSRISRTPLILSCAFLYYCLTAPLFITAQVGTSVEVLSKPISVLLNTLVGTVWGGFIVAALGDTQKTLTKQFKDDANYLVTGGMFKYLRHPNYTGEVVGWTASALLGIVAAILEDGIVPKTMLAFYTVCTVVGAAGIDFVLMAATKNLERKQKDKYGDTVKYMDWVRNSWAGFQLPAKEKEEHVEPHLELDVEEEEGCGSGI